MDRHDCATFCVSHGPLAPIKLPRPLVSGSKSLLQCVWCTWTQAPACKETLGSFIGVGSLVVSQIRNLGHNTRACCPDITSMATLTAPQALCAQGTQARGCGEGNKCPGTRPSSFIRTEGAQTSWSLCTDPGDLKLPGCHSVPAPPGPGDTA